MIDRESKLIQLTADMSDTAMRPLTRANADALRQLLSEATKLLDELPQRVVDNRR